MEQSLVVGDASLSLGGILTEKKIKHLSTTLLDNNDIRN